MSREITSRTSLDNLKREAKRWLKALEANDAQARARLQTAHPTAPANPTLRDVQHALAREYGLQGWAALKARIDPDAVVRRYDVVADALVVAYETGEHESMRIVWNYFGHMRVWDGMKRYVRLDLGKREAPEDPDNDRITLAEARYLVARAQGFRAWDALIEYALTVPAGRELAAKPLFAVRFDDKGKHTRVAQSRDWEEIIAILREQRIEGLGADGQMTDALLDRITRLEHITALDLSGSRDLTDNGLRLLARLPGLKRLNLGGCAQITDRGLSVLRELPALEHLSMWWSPVSDAGLQNLESCHQLVSVELSGTYCGDGTIRACRNKPNLATFFCGNAVTDAGIPYLHEFPVFKEWRTPQQEFREVGFDNRHNHLALRGPFTNAGIGQLAGLDGLHALNLDDSQLTISGPSLAPLTTLPHLEWLSFDAHDESMPYIAALPHLRFLSCQDTDCTDVGWEALGQSQTIESIWGRRCYGLMRGGFLALSRMPALRELSASCKNVDDVGFAAFPEFPVLRSLMPMDVPDHAYVHIGKCTELTKLTLMYCRDTGDEATSHITGLSKLREYFASYNRITDRTPELLSGIASLESITFDSCSMLSDDGIAHLARLPRLNRLRLDGMPKVTQAVVSKFGSGVTVHYSV